VPLNQEAMALEPGLRSVMDARRWVAKACLSIGREDLIEAAEMGTAELVANALIHARPPIRLRLRGTREHPRVEVFDGSHQPPAPNPRMTDDDELLSTIGRGLGLVAMCATAWGAEIQRTGKVVWFEPAVHIAEHPITEGDLFEPDAIDEQRPVTDGLSVVLLEMPTQLYADFQRHYQELRRELRLLALAHGDAYPLATSLSTAFRAFDDDLARARGTADLDLAVEDDGEQADITLQVPPGTADSASRMIDMLELADAFCRSERLLSLSTPPEQKAFQRWYLGEFVRQAAGELPESWGARPRTAAVPRYAPGRP
jgi:anti-sigma regulatory factor (Ser/Thr protein kinase)